MKPALLAIPSFLLLTSLASGSMAQAQRAFVSGLGDDNNPCTRTAPCRTFTRAVMQTNAGGEVVALDSAGYGPFTIAKAITVQAPPGVYAGISVLSGDGIDISAGALDTVVLRGLSIISQGGVHAIVFNSGQALHIENCVISGFTCCSAFNFSGPGNLMVKDSMIRDNGTGIVLNPPSGTVLASLDNVRLEANNLGLSVEDGAKATVRSSNISGNTFGFDVGSGSGTSELNVENCLVSNNTQSAVQTSAAGATVRVSGSTVTDNGRAFLNISGAILSRSNNTIEGNASPDQGVISTYLAK